jgi:hypothetical protein
MAKDRGREGMCVVETIKSNIGLEAEGRDWRLELVQVEGVKDEVPRLVPKGVATTSVDDLLRAPAAARGVPAEDIQAVILRELESGPKGRKYLDAATREELGVSADTTYQRGLIPLRDAGQITANKDGFGGGRTCRSESVVRHEATAADSGFPHGERDRL